MRRIGFGKTTENNLPNRRCMRLEPSAYRLDRHTRRLRFRVTVHPGGNARKGNAAQAMFLCQSQTSDVARGQKSGLIECSARPDRPHRMNHMPGNESITRREMCRARGTAHARRNLRHLLAGRSQFRTCRAMDRAIHAAATEHAPVGGVHDDIHIQRGDVIHNNI